MNNTLRALATLAILGLMANAQSKIGFGPYFQLGPLEQTWIREATTTLILPDVPSPQVDRLALWPGMQASRGDLIQALAVSMQDPYSNCGGSRRQWCTWASTLEDAQLGGREVPANPGDELVMHYKYNDNTGQYDQSVSRNGQIISRLSTNSGHAYRWETAAECQESACQGQVAFHTYKSTTIILDSPDESFGDSLQINDADSSGLNTVDNGKTWTVDTINMHAYTYNQ